MCPATLTIATITRTASTPSALTCAFVGTVTLATAQSVRPSVQNHLRQRRVSLLFIRIILVCLYIHGLHAVTSR